MQGPLHPACPFHHINLQVQPPWFSLSSPASFESLPASDSLGRGRSGLICSAIIRGNNVHIHMQELIAQEPKNWLQLYVDAVTEKDPYKRLALVRRLRQVPRHDESDENPERPRVQTGLRPAVLRPAQVVRTTQGTQRAPLAQQTPRPGPSPVIKAAEPSGIHKIRKTKPKVRSKSVRRSPRLRSA